MTKPLSSAEDVAGVIAPPPLIYGGASGCRRTTT